MSHSKFSEVDLTPLTEQSNRTGYTMAQSDLYNVLSGIEDKVSISVRIDIMTAMMKREKDRFMPTNLYDEISKL